MLHKMLEEKLIEAVNNVYNLQLSSVFVEHPNDESWGDYASNVALTIAKDIKQSPLEIAKTLCYELENMHISFEFNGLSYHVFEKMYPVAPGFINFILSKEWLYYVLYEVHLEGPNYGASDFGANKKILIEFSQPNPNKAQHIGHARNNFLGSSIANIYNFLGYDVIRANYVNDWGTHICKAMLMYKKYGENKEPDKQPDHFVGDFYSMYEQEEESNPSLKEEVADLFYKLEHGDKETTELWEKIVGWAIKGWERTYKDQGISFDTWFYQHSYRDSGKEVVNIAIEKGIAEKDETGAVIARLEKYDLPDKVLLRSDGTSIYSTQDLQMAKDNVEEFGLDKRVYVVDYRQSDYFNQIFKVMEILGLGLEDKLHHLAYGIVSLPEGKMSSRKGIVAKADDVYDSMVEIGDSQVHTNIPDRDEVVHKVAMTALKYALLRVDPKSNIVFNQEEVTQFTGNTGPYILYARVRANSVLEKSAHEFEDDLFDVKLKELGNLDEKELAVIRHLYKFPEVVLLAGQEFAPNHICNYMFELAQKFSTFYNDLSILNVEDNNVRDFRLCLTSAVKQVLTNSLDLLAMPYPDKM